VTAAGDTRERILRATLRLIGEQGIGRVTNRAVAAQAGVSLGSLTYHFATQGDLLRDALLLFVGEEAARLEAFAATIEGADLTLEEVAAGMQQIVRQSRPHEQIAQIELYLEAARDPALQDAATRSFAAYDHVTRVTLQALGVPDPEPLIPALLALVDGFELRRRAVGVPADEALVDALAALVRVGLETGTPG
jgi:AcrR family transcriptional regulator